MAHSTAATTEGNSSGTPSPVVLTIRPPWSATIGRAASRCSRSRPRGSRLVLTHKPTIANDVGGEDRGKAARLGASEVRGPRSDLAGLDQRPPFGRHPGPARTSSP